MISVIIPTLNAADGLGATLAALVPGAVEGVIREVIVVDAHSVDQTTVIADACGATIVVCDPSRGRQLRLGAATARGEWLLFLHADTVLEPAWINEVDGFRQRHAQSGRAVAAVFTLALDDHGLAPRLVEFGVFLRSVMLKQPYGDQGLLISRALYDDIGGYRDMPLMEDVDIVQRLGRSRIEVLRTRAVTSAVRYRKIGYLRRVVRNLLCRSLYAIGVPIATIERWYR